MLAVDGFAGPRDWWLEMARAQKIDLSTCSIAALIGAFATALEKELADRSGARLAHWASWTVTAATLTELWSRLLLPQDAPASRAAVEEAEALRRAQEAAFRTLIEGIGPLTTVPDSEQLLAANLISGVVSGIS